MNLASMQFQNDLLLKTKLERLIKRFDIFSYVAVVEEWTDSHCSSRSKFAIIYVTIYKSM